MKRTLSLLESPPAGPSATLSAASIRSSKLPMVVATALGLLLLLPCRSAAQEAQSKEVNLGGYSVHQTVDLGGHILDQSGSHGMYNTLVNLQSGPRILSHTLSMHAIDSSTTPFFDQLSSSSFGYGGDPNGVTRLRFSKGRLYDFSGLFRRDRQYFDYNLLDNTLISPTAVVYAPQLDSPHLFNTVRRMTDVSLTLFPLSRFHVRAGYSSNVTQGPSLSSIHTGAEGLLSQNWRYSTDSWMGGIDFVPFKGTTVSFDEFIVHYKGDTSWQLTGLNSQLSNGAPVSYGLDFPYNSGACANPTVGGVGNPRCNAYLQYNRYSPTRSIFPTEAFRFSSHSLERLEVNGRVSYTGGNSNMPVFNELFSGLVTRTSTRQETDVITARLKRINVSADVGATWQLLPRLSISDQFSFWNFRDPGNNQITDVTYAGTSLLAPPGAATTTVTPTSTFLNQKTKTNTFLVTWDATARTRLSVGHRYRNRLITNAAGDSILIHENWGLFDVGLRPTDNLRINADYEGMYADNAFTRISPRQLQHFRARATYQPQKWMILSGAANIFESRDNVDTVHHLEHSRDYSFGASVTQNEHYSVDLNYAHDGVFSRTDVCYPANPAPASAGGGFCTDAASPAYPGAGYLLGNAYYNAPAQYGSASVMIAPTKRLRTNVGYRITDVDGTAEALNPRQVPGSLQSRYITPFGNVAFNLEAGWTWKAEWNHYAYNEGSAPIGPTAPRQFRSELYTLSVRYAF